MNKKLSALRARKAKNATEVCQIDADRSKLEQYLLSKTLPYIELEFVFSRKSVGTPAWVVRVGSARVFGREVDVSCCGSITHFQHAVMPEHWMHWVCAEATAASRKMFDQEIRQNTPRQYRHFLGKSEYGAVNSDSIDTFIFDYASKTDPVAGRLMVPLGTPPKSVSDQLVSLIEQANQMVSARSALDLLEEL